jgi:transposase-like protein
MSKYSKDKKQHALALMSAPENLSVPEVCVRSGVSKATLYRWQREARAKGFAMPAGGGVAEGWSARDKLAVVIETAGLAQAELAEYCRKKGLFVEQVRTWREACESGIAGGGAGAAPALKEERKRNRELERELRRKERALAEAAALLVLSRKLEAFRTEGEDA